MIKATASFKIRTPVSGLLARVATGMLQGVTEAANKIRDDAKGMCPTDTGTLAGSIDAVVSKGIQLAMKGGSIQNSLYAVQGVISPHMPYAEFVEFGTGLVGQGTYPYELPESGIPFTDSWVYDYKRQNWHGAVARPYMRPALDSNRDAVVDTIRNAVQDALK